MFTKFDKEQGVTLIELLVVTGIISLLATGLVLLINPVQKIGQARDTQRKSDLAQLQRSLEIYYQDNDAYPASTASFTITGTFWGGPWTPYLSKLPKDPTTSRSYVYFTPNSGSCSNFQCYYLYASLQAGTTDPQSCFPGTTNACANAVAFNLTNRCGGVCNYGVTSANTAP